MGQLIKTDQGELTTTKRKARSKSIYLRACKRILMCVVRWKTSVKGKGREMYVRQHKDRDNWRCVYELSWANYDHACTNFNGAYTYLFCYQLDCNCVFF